MSPSSTRSHFLAFCVALPAVAYTWTPCSLDAWILDLQSCSQPCYGKTYYNNFFNSTVCGEYNAELNSTKKSDVECLCKNQIAGISTQTNITNCSVALCGDSFNESHYVDDLKAWTRMCLWSFGDGTCNGTTSTAASVILQPLPFLTVLGMVVGMMV